MGTFRYLDDIAPADCAVELSARNLNDLFETGAQVVTDVMVDPSTIEMTITRRVTLEAPSLDLLLFDWLSELICLKDARSEVFVRTQVVVSGSTSYRLEAQLDGGNIVPGITDRRADPKGVTLHAFLVEPRGGGWHARFVLDL